jgi:alkaline phosphatase
MAKYVDGFVRVVPKKNFAGYKKTATEASKVWRMFGALDYRECVGDHLHIRGSMGMPAPLSFVKLAKVKKGETVWFSYITYKSRAH